MAARVFTTPNIGYQLTLSDSNSDTSMRHEDVNIDSKIESITGSITIGKTGNNFPVNKWAYAQGNLSELDSIDFLPIPALSTPDVIGYRNEPNFSGFDDDYITIAIKPGGMLTAGTYSDILQFTASAVLQPESIPYEPIVAITYMQDMQSSICNAIPTPSPSAKVSSPDINRINNSIDSNTGLAGLVPEIYLKDKRDEKEYKIRKLADGNCWMAENLKYELKSGQTVPADKTDIASDWAPSNVKTSGAWDENDGTIGVISGSGYDGNYYTWFAATAGRGNINDIETTTSGTRIINGDVQSSICPKGWRLPAGNTRTGKSFYSLFKAYYPAITGTFDGDITTVTAYPLNFALAGLYSYSGFINYSDSNSYYWSSTAYTNSTYTYALSARSENIFPGTSNNRKSNGFFVRCVSR